MSAVLISRIIGLLVFGLGGFFAGLPIHEYLTSFWATYPFSNGGTIAIVIVVFAIFGFVLTPYITILPLQSLRKTFNRSSPQILISGLVGLLIGLILAAIVAYPLSLLPQPLSSILPVVCVFVFGYLSTLLFITRSQDFSNFFGNTSSKKQARTKGTLPAENERRILVDTSAIIDGRIADIARTGFLGGTLLVPRFVLNELQFVSDSADSLRRQRGRRGIEVLAELQQNQDVPVVISDIDVPGVREVDDRLVVLARQMDCPILTNDYNLNRIAELQGVKILNINDLANAVKVILLPGETFNIHVIQEGKEHNQGVGYLDDGTMVVVENGQRYLDSDIEVTVTKILQTSAGRMIFAKPEA